MAVKGSATVTISRVVDVAAIYRYYLRTSLLNTPTIDNPSVRPPTTGGTAWTLSEPSYSGGTYYLYFVDCNVLTDGSIAYSTVSLSSSYEAAKAAYNAASNAQSTANNAYNKATNTEKYFWHDNSGAHVSEAEQSVAAGVKNVLIDSDGLAVRNGTNVLASFEDNAISLGKSLKTSVIKMVKDQAQISAEEQYSEYGGESSLVEAKLTMTPAEIATRCVVDHSEEWPVIATRELTTYDCIIFSVLNSTTKDTIFLTLYPDMDTAVGDNIVATVNSIEDSNKLAVSIENKVSGSAYDYNSIGLVNNHTCTTEDYSERVLVSDINAYVDISTDNTDPGSDVFIESRRETRCEDTSDPTNHLMTTWMQIMTGSTKSGFEVYSAYETNEYDEETEETETKYKSANFCVHSGSSDVSMTGQPESVIGMSAQNILIEYFSRAGGMGDPGLYAYGQCLIRDSGSAFSMESGASTVDGKLAAAVIAAFSYADASSIFYRYGE